MATMAALLNQEPPALNAAPKELQRIVTRCLRKDLARRSQSMAEIKIELEDLKEETESGTSAVVTPTPKRKMWIAAGAVAIVLVAAFFYLLPQFKEERAPFKEVPLTTYHGYQGEPTLSPDGSQFAFIWDGGVEGAPSQLYVSLTGRGTPLRLTTPPGAASAPAWSPDGQTIAFVRSVPGKKSALTLIPALGGPERRLEEGGLSPAWSPDGKWLYFRALISPQTSALFVEPAGGGEKRRLIEPPAGTYGDLSPSVSPDGRKLVFVRYFADYNAEIRRASCRERV